LSIDLEADERLGRVARAGPLNTAEHCPNCGGALKIIAAIE